MISVLPSALSSFVFIFRATQQYCAQSKSGYSLLYVKVGGRSPDPVVEQVA